jgi:predicted metal-dependent hydrolase
MANGSRPKTIKRALLPIFDNLNETYFGGLVVAGIGYRNLSIVKGEEIYGWCDITERFIKINSILQDEEVPEFFLEYIVFHEMCHLVYTPTMAEADGHNDTEHNARFRSMERRYPMYKQSAELEQTKMPAILQKWRDYRAK